MLFLVLLWILFHFSLGFTTDSFKNSSSSHAFCARINKQSKKTKEKQKKQCFYVSTQLCCHLSSTHPILMFCESIERYDSQL